MLKGAAALGLSLAVLLSPRFARAEEEKEGEEAETVLACVRAAEDAQSQRSAHRLRAAFKGLLVCAQSNCPTAVRNDCVFWLAEVEKLQPSVVVKAQDRHGAELTDVSVTVDGEPLVSRLDGLAIPVDPGSRTFQFRHVGSKAVEKKVMIREGEKARTLSVAFDPPAPSKPVPVSDSGNKSRAGVPAGAVVFGGLGLVALGSFAYFGISGRSAAAELEDTCGRDKSCTEAQVSPVRTKLLIADISLGVSLVSLGAAAYLFFSRGDAAKAPPVSATVVLQRDRREISVRAAF